MLSRFSGFLDRHGLAMGSIVAQSANLSLEHPARTERVSSEIEDLLPTARACLGTLDKTGLPPTCPWHAEQVLDDDFRQGGNLRLCIRFRIKCIKDRPDPLALVFISDTHSLLRPVAIHALAGSDLIVHAGDIGASEVIDGLSTIAPVYAVRGDIDKGAWATKFPQETVGEVAGKSLYVLHNRNAIDLDPAAAGFDVVISGHSHKPGNEGSP